MASPGKKNRDIYDFTSGDDGSPEKPFNPQVVATTEVEPHAKGRRPVTQTSFTKKASSASASTTTPDGVSASPSSTGSQTDRKNRKAQHRKLYSGWHFESALHGKKIGTFDIDINQMRHLPEDLQIRPISEDYVTELEEDLLQTPRASENFNFIGMIMSAKEDIGNDDLHNKVVYLIDGNHTMEANRRLFELTKYNHFHSHQVVVYETLNHAEIAVLGSERNAHPRAKHLTEFQWMTLLRKQLFHLCGLDLENDEPPHPAPPAFSDIMHTVMGLHTVSGIHILKPYIDYYDMKLHPILF